MIKRLHNVWPLIFLSNQGNMGEEIIEMTEVVVSFDEKFVLY